MSATPDPQDPTLAPGASQGHEVEVDLAAFLPEGVTLGDPDEGDDAPVGEVGSGDSDEGDVPVGETAPEPSDDAVTAPDDAPAAPSVDLDALAQIERDLDAVDAAIAALDAGTYGIDAATGEPIPDHLLAEDPTRLS